MGISDANEDLPELSPEYLRDHYEKYQRAILKSPALAAPKDVIARRKERALQRVRAIDWSPREEEVDTDRCISLIMEYFYAIGRRVLSSEKGDRGIYSPFLYVGVEESYSAEEDEKLITCGLTRKTLGWYVNYEIHGGPPIWRNSIDDNPYEPLIQMYEIGGGPLSTEHGFLNLPGGGGMQIQSKWNHVLRHLRGEPYAGGGRRVW